jgi:hypothetical protein
MSEEEHQSDDEEGNSARRVAKDDDVPDEVANLYSWLYELIESMAVANLGIDTHKLFKRALRGEDVLLALSLFISPDMEHLWYRHPSTEDHDDVSSLLFTVIATHAFCTPVGENCGFEKLKVLHIDLRTRLDFVHWRASSVLPLLLLPNLIDLTLGGWGVRWSRSGERLKVAEGHDDMTYIDKPWTWPVRASSIKRLSLLHPSVTGPMIVKMLHACQVISRFELVHGDGYVPEKEWYDIVLVALAEHADTLTELSLGDKDAYDRWSLSGSGDANIYSQWTSLRSLRSPLYTMAGHDYLEPRTDDEMAAGLVRALPESIEYLWIELP